MAISIPQANPGAAYHQHRTAIEAAVLRALNSGWYILGEEVRAFEEEFAAWCDLPHVVGVASGTDALELALRVLDIGPGDEVITTPHTATATVSAIERAGAVPVLADIDPRTYTLAAPAVEAALTPRTKAIMPVHLFGIPADLAALRALVEHHQLALVEDCAQAHGARYQGKRVGTFGDLAAFSFYPTKNLGALGDGGAVGVSDPALTERLRSLAQYGWRQRQISVEPGMNSRLDELQAAILRVKLPHLAQDNARRVAIARRYSAALQDVVTVPYVPEDVEPVFHLYVIRHPERDALRHHLADRGIGTAIHYPVPIHLQPAYRQRLGDTGSFPEAERAVHEILSLPLYPELTDQAVDTVIEEILSYPA